jgi:uncharacterized protein YggE
MHGTFGQKLFPMGLICLLSLLVSQASAEDRSITVSGTGEATARPDMAEVDLAVVTEAEEAAAALDRNNQSVHQLFATLKSRDIAEKDIQTTQFNVSPKYDYQRNTGGPRRIVGYTVTNEVHVKVRRLSQLGELLDAAVGSGANRIQGIRFQVSNRDDLLDAARKDAVARARHTAQLLAQAAGAKLGPVTSIRELTFGGPQPLAVRELTDAVGSAVPVAPGRQSIAVQVTLTFSLAPDRDGD